MDELGRILIADDEELVNVLGEAGVDGLAELADDAHRVRAPHAGAVARCSHRLVGALAAKPLDQAGRADGFTGAIPNLLFGHGKIDVSASSEALLKLVVDAQIDVGGALAVIQNETGRGCGARLTCPGAHPIFSIASRARCWAEAMKYLCAEKAGTSAGRAMAAYLKSIPAVSHKAPDRIPPDGPAAGPELGFPPPPPPIPMPSIGSKGFSV